MRRTAEIDPGSRGPIAVVNLSNLIPQAEVRKIRPTPPTRAEKEVLVKEAYAEGYFRLLSEEQQLLLGHHFLELGSENYRSQSAFDSKPGETTRTWASPVEKKSVIELDRYKRLIDGEDVDDKWRRSLLENPEALSYLYSRFRTHRHLARVLGVKHKEMPDILRSQGVNMHPGHPSLDLHKVFGDDPKGEITRLKKLGYSIGRIAWLFCISDRTMKNVINDLGLKDVKPDK